MTQQLKTFSRSAVPALVLGTVPAAGTPILAAKAADALAWGKTFPLRNKVIHRELSCHS